MQIPIEPNLDIPMPSAAYPERGATFEERAKIAGNTALLLSELGMEEEITPEEAAKAKEMFAKIKPGDRFKHSANKLKIISPPNNTRANSIFESLPPVHRALKTTLNTKVKTINIKTGFKKDHKIPKIEPL